MLTGKKRFDARRNGIANKQMLKNKIIFFCNEDFMKRNMKKL